MRHLHPTVATGLAAGFLFFVHALLPSSHAWPLLWPLLGGVGAVVWAARRPRLAGFWRSVQGSAQAGSLAGALFFLLTVGALWLLGLPTLAAAAKALGADGGPLLTRAVTLSLGAVALLGPALASIAGAFAFPLVRHWNRG